MGKNFLNGKISWKEKLIEIMNFRKLEISWKYGDGDGQFFLIRKSYQKLIGFFLPKNHIKQTDRLNEWMNDHLTEQKHSSWKKFIGKLFSFGEIFQWTKNPRNQNKIQTKKNFHFEISIFSFQVFFSFNPVVIYINKQTNKH